MKYLILLMLVACGNGKGGGSASSSGSSAFVPACSNGGLNGTFVTGLSVLSVVSCSFTFIYGNGCSIDGTISNTSNDGGTLTATLVSQSGACGGIQSGDCTFTRTGSGVDLECPSLYIDGVFQ